MIALLLCTWLAAAFALVAPARAQAASTQSPAVAPPTSTKTVDELYYYAVRRTCVKSTDESRACSNSITSALLSPTPTFP